MPELFLRQAEILIQTSGGVFNVLKDFRITFQIEKTSESTPNPAKISLYNLSKDNQALFEQKNSSIILQAGYKGLTAPIIKTLFIGDIATAKTTKRSTDFITEIEAGDAEKKIISSYINKSFAGKDSASKGNNTTRDIVKELIKSMGFITNTTQEKQIDKKLEIVSDTKPFFGVTLSGPSKFILDTILEKEGLEWSVQNGEIQIVDASKKISAQPSVILMGDTGLLDVSKEEDNRINFRALLNPEILPTRTIKITSELMGLDGVFTVRRVNYIGDTHQGDWIVTGEAV